MTSHARGRGALGGAADAGPGGPLGAAASHSDQLASISRDERDNVIIVSISGEIDLSNAARIGREFTDIPNSALGLVVEIAGVDYLDSTAIALLYELHLRLERRGQRLVIVAPSGGTPRRILELAAFDKQATVIDDLEAAVTVVQAVGGSPG